MSDQLAGLVACVHGLGSALDATRRGAEETLGRFKADPQAWRQCCEFMQLTTEPQVLWYCCSILEDTVQRRWRALLPAERQYVRGFALHFTLESSSTALVTKKATQVCVHMAQRDWPQEWPDFLSHLAAVASSGSASSLKAFGVVGLLVEIVGLAPSSSRSVGGLRLHSTRRAQLRELMRAQIPPLVELLRVPLERESAPADRAAGGSSEERCAALLRVLTQFTSWPTGSSGSDAALIVPPSVLAATMRCAQWRSSSCGALALGCLSGIVDRNCYPADSEEYALGIATGVFQLLNEAMGAAGGGIAATSAEYREHFTAFLYSFISKLFVRAERAPTFPTDDFLALLFRYTLEQPSVDGFIACLDLWSLFIGTLEERQLYAEYDDDDDGSGSGAASARSDAAYTAGLHQLAMELLRRISFATNRETLLRLEATGAQLDALLDKAVDTLARIVMLKSLAPLVASALAPVLAGLATQLVGRSAESCATAEDTLAARDLDTMLRVLCTLVPSFAANATGTLAVAGAFIEQALAVAACCTERRLHTQGAVLRQVHVRALNTLAVFGHWLVRVMPREGHAIVTPAAFAAIVERAAHVGVASMSAGISPPPEAVLLAAAQLLATLSGVVRPACLATSPTWRGFTAELHTTCRDVPEQVHVQIVKAAVHSLVLLPLDAPRGAAAGWDERGVALHAVVAPIAQRLAGVTEMPGLRERRLYLQQYVASRVRLCASLLCAILAATRSASSSARTALAKTLSPLLPVLGALFSLYLATALDGAVPRAAAKRAMAVSTSLLQLQAALFDCLPRQLGKGYSKRVVGGIADELCAGEGALLRALLSARGSTTGGDEVVAHFLKLITVLAEESSRSFAPILPSVVSLCTDRVVPVLRPQLHVFVDTTDALLHLVRKLLMNHWDGVAALPGATLKLVDVAAAVLQEDKVPPSAAQYSVATLLEVDERHSFFSKDEFKTHVAVPLLQLFLRALVHGIHPACQDEMVRAVHAVARVDFGAFYTSVFPGFLIGPSCTHLNDANRHALVEGLSKGTGVVSFAANLARMVEDVQYLATQG